MATAIARIEGAGVAPLPDFQPIGMEVFATIPSRHGIALIQGHVAVYDEDDLHRNELEDGAFYVVEYQRPRAGMSWDMFHSIDSRRLYTSREVVRVRRCIRNPDHWWTHHCRSFFKDGPWPEFHLTDAIVGRVVGIYRPEGSEVQS